MVDDALARDALVREAAALAALDDPGVPRLVGVGEDEHGPYLLESALAGTPLVELVERWVAVPLPLALHLATRAWALLARIQATLVDGRTPLELVHGDLSPSNLIVSAHADVGLVDFGSSSSRLHAAPSPARGTLPYVAPELARSEAHPSQATDRYALAALLAELSVGRPLWARRDEPAMLLAIGEHGHDARALAGTRLPRRLIAALTDELAFEPEDRPPSAEPLAALFTHLFDDLA
jgi:serine/threonine-protein kinase